MFERLKVVLLYGGRSSEHEVSLRSAASVFRHLNSSRYDVIPIGMDKQGCFYRNDGLTLAADESSLPVSTPQSVALPSLLRDGRLALDADVVFPVVHGPLYEDGALQGLLELMQVPYVGCNVLSSALGMHKDMQRRVACVEGLRSAPYRVISAKASAAENLARIEQTVHDLGWPLFVKPCSLGSSVGIHKVHHLQELLDAVADAKRYDREVLIETFIKGREIELAVLEQVEAHATPWVSVPGEIEVRHPDGFYSYASKYLQSDATLLHIPAALNADMTGQLQQAAAAVFTRLGCRGMARVDFFVDDASGEIYFNEINTLPGFTSISMYPKLCEASGLPYSQLLDKLIELAQIHHRDALQLVTHYQ
jgi:D-alanine-D-alanine ligase